MLNQELNHKKARAPAKRMVSQEEAIRLMQQVQSLGMLGGGSTKPKEWMLSAEIVEPHLATLLREQLSRTGWQRVLRAIRDHNRHDENYPWDVSNDADFVSAVRMAAQGQKIPDLVIKPSVEAQGLTFPSGRVPKIQLFRERNRGAALSRLKVDLEERRAEALLNHALLPDLLEELYESHPLREGFLRERIRHRVALVVGSVVSAALGVIVGVIESIIDVLINSIGNFAPIIGPALLVFIATLMADTVQLSAPSDWAQLVAFLSRALWNASLAFGATLLVYGTWHYITIRRPEKGPSQRGFGTMQEGSDGSEQDGGLQAG